MENSPTITLRKGKTEIRVENASAIIKKVNELYPSSADYDGWCYAPSWNRKQKLSEIELEKQRRWIESAKDWFKNEMFGGSSDFEVIVNTPPTSEPIDVHVNRLWKDETDIQLTTAPQFQPFTPSPKTEPQVIQSVNKNAYEIRTDILAMALDFVRYKNELNGQASVTENDVLSTANQFYKFVENRK